MRDEGADFSFILLRGAEESTVYVKKRPYVDAFLKKVAEMFDIVVFTASISSYADQLLDILDPGRLISRRYYRDSCLSLGGKYLKDLTIVEANLMKVAIIDNTPEVCYSATQFQRSYKLLGRTVVLDIRGNF
jgi:CTD small phosphatase-like protein 2